MNFVGSIYQGSIGLVVVLIMNNVINICLRYLNKMPFCGTNESLQKYSGPNTVLAEYLKYYTSLKSPGYAVLVTGPWGVGKTFQVKQLIRDSDSYFVSLYGIDTVDGIHDAVLASCLPNFKANELVTSLEDVGKAMGEKFALAGFASNLWGIYLRQRLTPDRTIVFDDLERSSLWGNKSNELLGAINHYVEHRGFRVVVICHDERIEEELAKRKEKTFGHTINVKPQSETAFSAFLNEIQDKTEREFVTSNRSLIEEIWAQSEQSSLRILKHVINDVARLRSILKDKHLKNKEAIEHILKFFCALNIEVRAGNLNRKRLLNQRERYIAEQMNRTSSDDTKPLTKIISRYSSIDLRRSIFSDKILEAMLIDGRFDSEMMAAELDQIPHFTQESDPPPWLIVIKFDEFDDAILNEGINRMQKQFDERVITEIGEFLHIAALRLMMAEQGASGRTMEKEQSLCFAYIDDLLTSGRMPPKSLNYLTENSYSNDSGYGGYLYWLSDNTRPYFKDICDHVDKAQQCALEATYPEHVTEILRQLKEDQASISQTISPASSGNITFAYIPVLAKIPVNDFLEAWLSGPRSGWRQTTMALDNRYKLGQLNQHLSAEKPWLVDLEREMNARIATMAGLDAFRLKRLKPKIFSELGADSENQK